MTAHSMTMFQPVTSLVARVRQWNEARRERKRRQTEETERKQRHDRRLRPIVAEKGMWLPLSGDFVVTKHINGIVVRQQDTDHQVVVSTQAREFVISCASSEEAETVRRNIAQDGGLLVSSWSY